MYATRVPRESELYLKDIWIKFPGTNKIFFGVFQEMLAIFSHIKIERNAWRQRSYLSEKIFPVVSF